MNAASTQKPAGNSETSSRNSHIAEILSGSGNGPTAVSLDELAKSVAALGTGSSIGQILRIGELVYQGLYGSSRALQSDSGGASLRRLAGHPAIKWKVTSLWRAVSVYELSLRMPQLFDLPGLGVSHFRAVLGLPDGVQANLLTQAATERWTKRRLENEALRHRTERPRRGRRPMSGLEKWTRDASAVLAQLTELEAREFTRDDEERTEARLKLHEIRTACEQLENRLR